MKDSILSDVDDMTVPLMPLVQRQLKFGILFALQIPSLFCTLFIFYHFKWNHLHTQIYGFLLLVNGLVASVELSITLYFLYSGTIYSTKFCSGWIVLNYSLVQLSIFLMAWTSIERYLFIYHEHFIKKNIILLHYIPVTVFCLFTPLLYIGLVLIYPCQPMYDARFYLCGGPCYSLERLPGFYDWFGNGVAMQTTILSVNILLIVRHLVQRYRMKNMIITAAGRKQWRRSVKLASQLLAIALIYFIAWIPYTLVVLILMFSYSDDLAHLLSTYLVYAPYLQSLFLPYVCILFMPEVKEKLLMLSICRHFRGNQIAPNRTPTVNSSLHPNTMPS